MTEKRPLQIGDEITEQIYNAILGFGVVTRVTDASAFADFGGQERRFKRECSSYGRCQLIPNDRHKDFYLTTDDHRQTVRRKELSTEAKQVFQSLPLHNMPLSLLEKLVEDLKNYKQ